MIERIPSPEEIREMLAQGNDLKRSISEAGLEEEAHVLDGILALVESAASVLPGGLATDLDDAFAELDLKFALVDYEVKQLDPDADI